MFFTVICSILDFVQIARNLFSLQLDEVNVGAQEISNILDSQVQYALQNYFNWI